MSMKRVLCTLVFVTLQWGLYFIIVYAIDYLLYAEKMDGYTVYCYGTYHNDILANLLIATTIILPIVYYIVTESLCGIRNQELTDYVVQMRLYLVLHTIYSVVIYNIVCGLSEPHSSSMEGYGGDWTGVAEIFFGIFSAIVFCVVTMFRWERSRR